MVNMGPDRDLTTSLSKLLKRFDLYSNPHIDFRELDMYFNHSTQGCKYNKMTPNIELNQ
jgi:hypothetical protein